MIRNKDDYYPFGSVSTHWKDSTEKDYRFGYQGQFAEEDEETGYNHFEARDFDSRIGRWMAVDPYRVGSSPYIGMGNNGISIVDPDGGVPDHIYYNQNGSEAFRFDKPGDHRYFTLTPNSAFSTGFEAIEAFSRPSRTFGGFMSGIWNSNFVRNITGDFLSLSFDTDIFVGYRVGIQQFAFSVPLRGTDAFSIISTQSSGERHGLDISMGVNFTKSRYTGPVNAPNFDAGLSRNTLVGGFDDVNFGVVLGGIELSVGEIATHANEAGFKVHGRVIGIGGGPPVLPFSYNSSRGTTKLLGR